MKTVLTYLVVLISLGLNAQEYIISGYVTDTTTGKPLENVNITVFAGIEGASTNSKGYFSIKLKTSPATLFFSHVGYESKQITIKRNDTEPLKVKMFEMPITGPEIPIYAKAIPLMEDKPLYVWDYDFYGDNILLLACKYKKLNDPYLILMSNSGDTLTSLPVKRPEKLYKDCMDYIHMFTNDKVWQVYYDTTSLKLLYPMEIADFDSLFPKCLEELNSKFYLKQYYYRNQVLLYYSISKKDSSAQKIRVIGDELALERLAFNGRFWAMGATPNEHDLRFEEMAFFDPIFAPLVKLGDSLVIFNYVDDQIEFLTDEGTLIDTVPISYHKDKFWKEEIYTDEITKKVYALFKKDGITTLRRINLETGNLEEQYKIPDFIHVEKIKIRDNTAYFLYIERAGMEYRKLYKMFLK